MEASAVLTLICASILATPAQPPATEPKAAEKPLPVLSLNIHCDRAGLKVGDEVPIVFTIKNEGTSQYDYQDRNYDRSGRMNEYQLYAVDLRGKSVPDPRAKWQGGIGGGLSKGGKLAPGQSFSKTIALNRWALLTKPGTYRVTAKYEIDYGRGTVVSEPITIKLDPRTDREMARHIEKLATQLKQATDENVRKTLVRKLMYTCDRRTIPALIGAMYKADAATYWAGEAFNYYLTTHPDVNDAIVRAASTRGLAQGMFWTLKQRGFSAEQIMPLIDVSLSPANPDAWPQGAIAAQQYSHDRFAPRLIAIATDTNSNARSQAIYALAFNRTDESVATLKKLFVEPDPPNPRGRTIRQITEDAIRTAYCYRGNTTGRPLRKDDFHQRYQKRQ